MRAEQSAPWCRTRIHHAANGTPRENPEHRHHGPHRCRQDDYDRTDSLLHRRQLQDRRSAPRRRNDGLDGAGTGARDHHHLRSHHLFLEGSPHQHHRHTWPRGLHRRGGAIAARPGRCDRGLLRGWRRRAAVGDGLATGGQVPGSAPRLRQQDGSGRVGFPPRGGDDPGAAGREPTAPADSHRRGRALQWSGRRPRREGDLLG